MSVKNRDRQNTDVGAPLCGQQQHDAAWAVIQALAAGGMLLPIPEWEGDLAEGYANILGIKRDQ